MRQEESRIRELFQRLKHEDERHAPPFQRIWAAAQLRRDRRGQKQGVSRLAAVGVVMILLGAAWLALHNLVAKRTRPHEDYLEQRQVAGTGEKPLLPPVRKLPPPIERHGRIAYRRPLPIRTKTDLALLSQWRSPTEVLLHTPGAALLKTVPRLGESMIESKSFIPEQKNDPEE